MTYILRLKSPDGEISAVEVPTITAAYPVLRGWRQQYTNAQYMSSMRRSVMKKNGQQTIWAFSRPYEYPHHVTIEYRDDRDTDKGQNE